LEALAGAVRQFRTREEIWPLRVPAQPLVLEDVVDRALAGETTPFDPRTLRAKSLLRLTWADGAAWELWTMALPEGIRLYCDSDGEESRALASARRDSEIDPDRLFLELLAESGGEIFGIEPSGGPPAKVRSTLDDALLLEFFVHLFEVTGMGEDIRAEASTDLRVDVERWLQRVTS
jgi:hypothetical protein